MTTVDELRAGFEEFVAERYPPRRSGHETATGPVALAIVAGSHRSDEEERAVVQRSRAWQRDLFDAGFAWLTGPVELGGRGLSAQHEAAAKEVLDRYDVPDDTLIRTGTQVLGPSVVQFGTDHLRRHHMPAVHRGDELMCQLFSEPDAGSDLANITTRATPDGDGWVLDGQKVWCSGGLHADVGVCIARSDPASERHRGLSAFLVSMTAPGVEIRRIEQMTGGAEFCEVFLSGVRVDRDHLVGEEGGGWAIVIDALMNERSSIGSELLPEMAVFDRLLGLVRAAGAGPVLRQVAADAAVRINVARLLERRIRAPYGPGETPGPEFALTKLALTDVVASMSAVAAQALGPALIAQQADALTGDAMTADGMDEGAAWSEFVLGAPGLRIGGGTDEILKNGVAERVLGLPREPAAERR